MPRRSSAMRRSTRSCATCLIPSVVSVASFTASRHASHLVRDDPRLTVLSLEELVSFRRAREGFRLRVEGEASFPGTPGDIRQVAKECGLVTLFHIRRRQRARSDALQEVLDVRLVTLAAGAV